MERYDRNKKKFLELRDELKEMSDKVNRMTEKINKIILELYYLEKLNNDFKISISI